MRKKTIEKEDIFIGQRLKHRRSSFGISQSRLAQLEKLTFQQVQKYESGKNRISASRLYRFARILHVPISYFFDGMDDEISESKDVNIEYDTRFENDQKKLNTSFLKIKNKILRNSIIKVAMDFAKIDKNWKGNWDLELRIKN